MKTRVFCELIEEAIRQRYGEEVSFDTVPYDHDDGKGCEACLGVFLTEDVHMAVVAAQAMYLIWTDEDGRYGADEDKDEALGDFVDLMEGVRFAPYMQWTCAYFPGLTRDQVLADAESTEDGRDDPVDGSFVPGA